jgi:hypothetical protein
MRNAASLIGPLGSSAFRLSALNVNVNRGRVPLFGTGDKPLYGVFFVKEFAWAAKLSFDGFLV